MHYFYFHARLGALTFGPLRSNFAQASQMALGLTEFSGPPKQMMFLRSSSTPCRVEKMIFNQGRAKLLRKGALWLKPSLVRADSNIHPLLS